MPPAKKTDAYVMPRKLYWHLYSLQRLNVGGSDGNGGNFVKVVNKILRKQYRVIK